MEKAACSALEQKMKDYLAVHSRRDLLSLYEDRALTDELIAALAEPWRGKADFVAAPESLGFIVGSLVARQLGIGFIPIRNAGWSTLEEEDRILASYIDHNNRVKSLHVHRSTFPAHSRILLADDWVDTAATMQACTTIVEEAENTVAGIVALGAGSTEVTRRMAESGALYTIIRP